MKDYSSYHYEDFALDEDFLLWVKHPDAKQEHFWQQFLRTHPEKSKEIEVARELILSANNEGQFSDQEKSVLWQNIVSGMNATPEIVEARTGKIRKMRFGLLAAASVIGILLFASLFYFLQGKKQQLTSIASHYGQRHTMVLPDSSVVVLNSNSKLDYRKEWSRNNTREVWLSGEAFFRVQHVNKNADAIKNSDRFIVHLDKVDVEVLGTTFNVFSRHNNARITLNSGKVQLGFKELNKTLVMQPGELVAYNRDQNSFSKMAVDVSNYSSWINGILTFDKTPMQEVIRLLKDNYGYSVQVKEPGILQESLTGQLPAGDIELVLKGLGSSLQLNVEKKDSTIFMERIK